MWGSAIVIRNKQNKQNNIYQSKNLNAFLAIIK